MSNDTKNYGKNNNEVSLPGYYGQVPHPITTHQGVKDGPYRLYVIIASHCIRGNETCWPSIERLAKLMNKSEKTIKRELNQLYKAGVLRNEGPHPKYRTTIHRPILPDGTSFAEWAERMSNLTKEGVKSDPHIPPKSDPHEGRNSDPQNHISLKQKRETKNEERTVPPSAAVSHPLSKSTGKTKSKKPKPIKDPESLMKALDAVNLVLIYGKWKDRDLRVREAWAGYVDLMLNGCAKKPWPNPFNDIDLAKGFNEFCERNYQWDKYQHQSSWGPSLKEQQRTENETNEIVNLYINKRKELDDSLDEEQLRNTFHLGSNIHILHYLYGAPKLLESLKAFFEDDLAACHCYEWAFFAANPTLFLTRQRARAEQEGPKAGIDGGAPEPGRCLVKDPETPEEDFASERCGCQRTEAEKVECPW